MSFSNNFPTTNPTLELDFANVGALDPRVTFTRSTTATYYDGVTTAKAEENLLLHSQEFNNAAWNKGAGVTVTTNSTVAPDGSVTADNVAFATGGAADFLRTFPAMTVGVVYTVSVYALLVGGTPTFRFDIGNAAGPVSAAQTPTTSWQRFSFTFTFAGANSWIDLEASGPGTIAFWGAQVEQRSSVTAYTPTTTQPITNYIPVLKTAAAGVPRFDHNPTTGEALGLLIEEQRTNLFVRSEEFDVTANWTPSNLTVTANTDTAPNGTLSADTLTATAANAVIQQAASVTNAAVYTYTVWIKRKTGTGVVSLSDLNGNYVPVTVDATWTRFSLTSTAASTTGRGYIRLTTSGDEVYVWGAQLEAGSFATSYIPTVASQVTRSADVASMTGTAFSSWYNQNEGTLYAEFDAFADSGSYFIASISDGTNNNRMQLLPWSSRQGQIVTGGVDQALFDNGTLSINTTTKVAIAYAANNSALSLSGASPATDNTVTVPSVDRLLFGNATSGANPNNGHIRKVAYYPVRLSSTQLQAITS